jgi:hypothetical protein
MGQGKTPLVSVAAFGLFASASMPMIASRCRDYIHRAADQVGRESRQTIVLILGPAEFDGHIPALDEARFAQAQAERTHEARLSRALLS